MNDDLQDEEKINKQKILYLVVLIVVLIISLGLFFKSWLNEKIVEKDHIRRRLDELNKRIAVLKAKKDRILKLEKMIFLYSRMVIGLIIVVINVIAQNYATSFFDITQFLNINGAIILLYTFIGFVAFGSINNMVTALKSKVARIMRKNHVASLEELELYIKEKRILEKELEDLKYIPDLAIVINQPPEIVSN